MTPFLPTPSYEIAHIRHAHTETERGARFAALVDRLVAREAARDPDTGFLSAEAATHLARMQEVYGGSPASARIHTA